MKRVRGLHALACLALLALVLSSCEDWTLSKNPVRSISTDCCTGSDKHWYCKVQVRAEEIAKGDGLGVTIDCYEPRLKVCSSDEANAEQNAIGEATLYYKMQMKETIIQGVKCWPMATCIQVQGLHRGPIDANPGPFYPLDTGTSSPGTCDGIEPVDAGPPAACLGVGGACGDCMNTYCCAQVAACGDDPDCASVLNYWLGSGPENTALDDAAQSLAACFSGSCTDACSPYFGGIRRLDARSW